MTEELKPGIILTATRRHVTLLDEKGEQHDGVVATRAFQVCVGDTVSFSLDTTGAAQVYELTKRRNKISRNTIGKEKLLATNLDLLILVTAVDPLFNTTFIDRVSVVASLQDIPLLIVINKTDLHEQLKQTEPCIKIYNDIGFSTHCLSAKKGDGLESLENIIAQKKQSTIALTGISGVGKSTIINTLMPKLTIETSDVSRKTGQGKQTTSQAMGYHYAKNNGVIIDLPGVQQFGITQLTKEQVRGSFPEFQKHSPACRFANCWHLEEPECGIKAAIDGSNIATSRYQSYCDMLDEIQEAKPY